MPAHLLPYLHPQRGSPMLDPETERILRRTATAFRLFVIAGLALSAAILLLIVLRWHP